MHTAQKCALIVAAAAGLGLTALPAGAAEILYSSFAAGEPHINSGYCVSGNTTAGCGPLTDRWIAQEFSPSTTHTLGGIDLALLHNSGPNDAEIDLVGDSSGHPGTTIIESWTGLSTSFSSNLSLTSQLNPLLTAGQDYWVVARDDNSATLDFWFDDLSTNNPSLLSLDDGTSWIATAGNRAMTVFGAVSGVPEPQTWTMMLLGFGFCGALLRKSRRKSAPIV